MTSHLIYREGELGTRLNYGCILLGLFWLFLLWFRNNGISISKRTLLLKTEYPCDLRTTLSAHARVAAQDFPPKIPQKNAYSVYSEQTVVLFDSVHSAIGSTMSRMIFCSFRKRIRSQQNTNTVYSEYSYSGIVPKERAL